MAVTGSQLVLLLPQCVDRGGELHRPKLHPHVGCQLLLRLWGRMLEELQIPLPPGLRQRQHLREGAETPAQRGNAGKQP